jgi:hypothetical protein
MKICIKADTNNYSTATQEWEPISIDRIFTLMRISY